MKKGMLCWALLILILFVFFITGTSANEQVSGVDRSPTLRYPEDTYTWLQAVEVFYQQDKYYHQNILCSFIVSDQTDYLHMSRYEAVERGFLPCPNCIYEKVDIREK